MKNQALVLTFSKVRKKDLALVGGKNAALGEMYNRLGKLGVSVPDGFCVTAKAFREFLIKNKIRRPILKLLKTLDARNTKELMKRGQAIRQMILAAEFPENLRAEILKHYKKLSVKYKTKSLSVAVRSSATAEDLPMASFAGQLESFLNISGKDKLLAAIKECFASLYTDRAISYRQDQKFSHAKVYLSVGIQKMVRSDRAGSGVMFTLDTESGFRELVLINASFGLGENIVKGRIDPDEYYVYKKTFEQGFPAIIKKRVGRKQLKMIFNQGENFTKNIFPTAKEKSSLVLTDKEIMQLAKWGLAIEKYFKQPMDIEWAKDGLDKKIYIVQARPETVFGKYASTLLEEYKLEKTGKVLLDGVSVGQRIGQGQVRVISDLKNIAAFRSGEVLVAKMTDPAWEPIMKKASAIITDSGGRTCHAAIISRELGIPCVVGAKLATKTLVDKQKVTVDCASSAQGKVYAGYLNFSRRKINLTKVKLPKKVKIMMNLANPEAAFSASFLPNHGIGLAREEFIINDYIKIHPLALINYYDLPRTLKAKIETLTPNYSNKKKFFIDKLAEGIGQLAASVYPKEIIVRFSDFKTNEYRQLLGGDLYEPREENPMIGWRGAARYYDPKFKPAFVMECQAIQKVIKDFGLTNVSVMIPFTRTVDEARQVIEIIKQNGWRKPKDKKSLGGKIYLMCELPVNVLLAKDFLKLVDGYSIGSNDLTQLIMGVDRDSALVSHLYDERNPAVLQSLADVIAVAKKMKKKIGICGQAPSDFPDFAKFLVKHKIDSLSLNPDSVVGVIKSLKL